MLPVNNILHNILRHQCNTSTPFRYTKEMLCNETNKTLCLEKMRHTATTITTKSPKNTTYAAVLVPIVYTVDNELKLLYTLRSGKLRKHVRQVSFPGGIRDDSDTSFVECALRETEEEIGLSRERINIWGETHFFYPRDGPAIMPVIGCIDNYDPSQLKINEDEVERVFTVSVNELCLNKKHTQFRTGYSLPVFTSGSERIWGITAIITNLFLHSLLPRGLYKSHTLFVPHYKSI